MKKLRRWLWRRRVLAMLDRQIAEGERILAAMRLSGREVSTDDESLDSYE